MKAALPVAMLVAIALAAGCGGTKAPPPPSAPDIGWTQFGGASGQARASALAQVDRATVNRLTTAWTFSPGPETAQWESYPVVAGRTMYVTTNTGEVLALDATTGRRRWSYAPPVDLLATASAGATPQPVNRGVTVAGSRVFAVTYDDRLIALRARDGHPLWTARIADPATGATETSPPAYWQGRLIVGGSGSDTRATPGFVTAFDARTGRRLWRFATVAPGHGGGRVWMPPTVDATTGLVYAGTGNPSPALTTARRTGCERWVSGLVALDAKTGALRWGAHEVCGDAWDYDGGQPPLVFDTRSNGRTVRAVGHANKSGTYWIRDAQTGRALAPPLALDDDNDDDSPARPRERPTAHGTDVCPGAFGGVPYSPAALSTAQRTIYQPVVSMCMRYQLGSATDSGAGHVELGGGVATPVPGQKARGALVAIDADHATIRWRRTLPAPMVGGALVTAGGLVFSGCDDGNLYAFDARTGAIVWHHHVGLPFGTAPLTYRIAGVQYVAVVAGGSSIPSVTGTRPGARLVVLRLPARPARPAA
jgi:glucose dehydrogenase